MAPPGRRCAGCGTRSSSACGGTSHANSLAGNACVDDQIAAYLADGTLPPRKPGNRPDATYAPLPQPVPRSQTAAVAAANNGVVTRLRQTLAHRQRRVTTEGPGGRSAARPGAAAPG